MSESKAGAEVIRKRIRAIDQRLRVLDKGIVAAYEVIDGIRAEKAGLELERAAMGRGEKKE